MNATKRAGYYVEGRYFAYRLHQARARAAHLSREYGRGIDITHLDEKGKSARVSTTYNYDFNHGEVTA